MLSSATESAATLKRWEDEEAAVRARLSDDVRPISPAALASRSGMEVFDAIFAGELPAVPIGKTLDFLPVHVEHGIAIFQGRPGPAHYNPLGSVHGGYAATLLDSAMGLAVQSMLPAGTGHTTLEFKISFIKAMTKDTGVVRSEGRTLSVGRRAATAEGRITDAKGRLLAHATTTCLIFEILKGT
jgi:uncharacterized protein (TIGR00369 family)